MEKMVSKTIRGKVSRKGEVNRSEVEKNTKKWLPYLIFLKTENNNFDNLTKDIKKNMFYHLKYNKIDLNVFKDLFYLKRKNDWFVN